MGSRLFLATIMAYRAADVQEDGNTAPLSKRPKVRDPHKLCPLVRRVRDRLQDWHRALTSRLAWLARKVG